MKTSDGGERPFALREGSTIIGRDYRCGLHVPLPSVDLRHCEITVNGAAARLRDLGSSVGTLHNGARAGEAPLADGDQITIGPVTFVVRISQA